MLFALHDATLLSGMDLHGVMTKSVEPIHTGSSKVDLFLELFEAPDGTVVGHVEYDSSLWQKASIHSLVNAFHVSLFLAASIGLACRDLQSCHCLFLAASIGSACRDLKRCHSIPQWTELDGSREASETQYTP